jgi:hypothetical protein
MRSLLEVLVIRREQFTTDCPTGSGESGSSVAREVLPCPLKLIDFFECGVSYKVSGFAKLSFIMGVGVFLASGENDLCDFLVRLFTEPPGVLWRIQPSGARSI